MADRGFSRALRLVLDSPVPDEEARRELEALGLEPTYLNRIHLNGVRRASEGHMDAVRFVRDALGEEQTGESLTSALRRLSDEELEELAEAGG